MKKSLMFVMLGIISFLGINSVSADEIYLDYNDNVSKVKSLINEIGYDTLNNSINMNIKYYNENLSSNFPYYFISLYYHQIIGSEEEPDLYIILTAIKEGNVNDFYHHFSQAVQSRYLISSSRVGMDNIYQIRYNYKTNEIVKLGNGYESIPLFGVYDDSNFYRPYNYYFSNFDFYYKGSLFTQDLNNELNYLNYNDTLHFQNLENPNSYLIYPANSDFLIEPYYLYDNNNYIKEYNYTTIDLNNYSYVALTLKDYNTIPDNNFSTYTNVYVKGQLCITPVYNYGMTERKDILTGTQIQGCSEYYNDFTINRMYILKDDVKNHAIYYLKAYDTSRENKVKIDISRFNISYISEENKDNPSVSIGGKNYPTISYDSLTDTSTKSESEGYVSGVSCPVGDINCYKDNNSSNTFDELFSSPLEFFKDIFSSVKSIFNIIVEFINLLPPLMQSFLYTAFTIAIVLGIIKIIL